MSDPKFEEDWYGEGSKLTRLVERRTEKAKRRSSGWIYWFVSGTLIFFGTFLIRGGPIPVLLILLGAVVLLMWFFQLHGSDRDGGSATP